MITVSRVRSDVNEIWVWLSVDLFMFVLFIYISQTYDVLFKMLYAEYLSYNI